MTPAGNPIHTTDPNLLEQVRDWQDSRAWLRFVSQYEPHLRAVCGCYRLTGHSADDCRQQVWLKLAARMRKFRYDPGLRFRGWLHRFFHCRVKDFLKAARRLPLEEPLREDGFLDGFEAGHHDDEPCDPEILAMLRQAEEIQAAVRARIRPDNWRAYWLIAVEDWSIDATATLLGKNHININYAYVTSGAPGGSPPMNAR